MQALRWQHQTSKVIPNKSKVKVERRTKRGQDRNRGGGLREEREKKRGGVKRKRKRETMEEGEEEET